MKFASVFLACIALVADAFTTYVGVKSGHKEANPVRKWMIDKGGLLAGTYGAALLFSGVIVAVNMLSKQPTWALILGNVIVAMIAGYAAYRNEHI